MRSSEFSKGFPPDIRRKRAGNLRLRDRIPAKAVEEKTKPVSAPYPNPGHGVSGESSN